MIPEDIGDGTFIRVVQACKILLSLVEVLVYRDTYDYSSSDQIDYRSIFEMAAKYDLDSYSFPQQMEIFFLLEYLLCLYVVRCIEYDSGCNRTANNRFLI